MDDAGIKKQKALIIELADLIVESQRIVVFTGASLPTS